jgi:hypothetical protein
LVKLFIQLIVAQARLSSKEGFFWVVFFLVGLGQERISVDVVRALLNDIIK